MSAENLGPVLAIDVVASRSHKELPGMRPNRQSPFAHEVHDGQAAAEYSLLLIRGDARKSRHAYEAEGPNACDSMRPERAAICDDSPPCDTGCGDVLPTRAIRVAHRRIHVQRELWLEFRRVGARELRREIDLFEAAIAQLEPLEPLAGPPLPRLRRGVVLDAQERWESIDIDPSGHLDAQERSGPTEIDRTGHLDAQERSGPTELDRTGHLDAQERSGPTEIDPTGHLDAQERSGSIDLNRIDQQRDIRPRKQKRTQLWVGMLIMAAMLATGVYAKDRLLPAFDPLWRGAALFPSLLLQPRGISEGRHKPESTTSLAQSAAHGPRPPGRSDFSVHLPDSYGIYVVSDGRLTRLESLRMRVPDTRIALPGVITKPSPTAVPAGSLSFIAYQRELMTNAPDSASVRVIAKVARALSFAATGKPTITNIEDTWAIRDISVELTVAPVPGNQEMVLIRTRDPNISLSPGRYMLAFNKQAYDFAVEGPIADTAHCLERTETQNGAIYSECRELPAAANGNATWRHSALRQTLSTQW